MGFGQRRALRDLQQVWIGEQVAYKNGGKPNPPWAGVSWASFAFPPLSPPDLLRALKANPPRPEYARIPLATDGSFPDWHLPPGDALPSPGRRT